MEQFLAIWLFAFVTAVTPGPNNFMLMSSGLNFGIRASLPHCMGICFGFPAMVAAVGLGLGSLFLRFPIMHLSIKIAGIGYLLFLAWKIARSHQSSDNEMSSKPFTFLQAAAFQWVNPKAWIMAIGAMATYTQIDGDVYQQIAVIVLAFFSVTFPCVAIWLLFGASLQRWLKQDRQRIYFNRVMALLLVVSIIPMMDFR